MKSLKDAENLLELGQLYCDRGDFIISVEKLRDAAEIFYSNSDFDSFLKCQNLLLRMYAEMEDSKSIEDAKERLQDLVINDSVELNSKTYYTLALCASYKGQPKMALEYLEKALALALSKDNKSDICYAINGLAVVYYSLGRLEDALKEIYNLQVFFQVLPLPDLKLSSQILNGLIFRKMGQFDKALEVFWLSYEGLKERKQLYTYQSLLLAMGNTYADIGELDISRMYLELVRRSVDPKNHVRVARILDERIAALGERSSSQYDLVFDAANNSVVERKKGKVDFKNQFILLDLLRLFLRHPGEVYTKESLVKRVWKQEYDPSIHDNKIYVTIKRLRKMIEPDYEKPKYIFRAKNGYYLNKNTKVLFEQ